MNRIDIQQHFWKVDPVRDSGINLELKCLQRDLLPPEISPQLDKSGFQSCILVQTGQSEKETDFLISLAKQYEFIKGVIGWIDLQAIDISERLEWYKPFKLVKGFRHLFPGEPRRDLMLQPNFKRGIAALQHFGYTYDLLISPGQLRISSELVASFPGQKFVLDQMAKPLISSKEIARWKMDITDLAYNQNVFCKISARVMDGDWRNWKKEDIRPYIDVIINAFGLERVMFGSYCPLYQIAASHEVGYLIEDYFSTFSREERELFFKWNAIDFYNL